MARQQHHQLLEKKDQYDQSLLSLKETDAVRFSRKIHIPLRSLVFFFNKKNCAKVSMLLVALTPLTWPGKIVFLIFFAWVYRVDEFRRDLWPQMLFWSLCLVQSCLYLFCAFSSRYAIICLVIV